MTPPLSRPGWRRRSAILIGAAVLLRERLDAFARLIAQEGGKPLTDARIEAIRAVDGLRNAAEEIRNFAGREIPMGLTPASDGRWAFTTREPIGVVAAVSAFNHPLNLIVRRRMSRNRQAGCADAAVLPGAGRPAPGGGPPGAVVPDPRHRG
jgi:acyl-CoA reductase-like NAD-dependent aldehyde dehydrogenase